MPSSPHPLVCVGSVLSAACIQPSAPPGAEPHVTAWVLALTLGTLCLTNDPSSIPGAHPEPPSLLSPDPGGHDQAWEPRSEHVEAEEI